MENVFFRISSYSATRISLLLGVVLFFASVSHFANAAGSQGSYASAASALAACVSFMGQSGVNNDRCYTNADIESPSYVLFAGSCGSPMRVCSLNRNTDGVRYLRTVLPDSSRSVNYWNYTIGCPSGFTEDPVTHLCVEEDLPPFDCGIGYYNSDGGSTEASCVAIPPASSDLCGRTLGFIDGVEICSLPAASCAESGGYYGTINETAVCIPPGDDVPQCEVGTFVFVEGTGSNGFSCVSPGPRPPTNSPRDSDGDDIPNSEDTDDDNDGIPDGSDPDADGDGVADADGDGDGVTDGEDDDDDGDGIGDGDDSDSDGNGAGDCDPTSKDYSACISSSDTLSDEDKAFLLNDFQYGLDVHNALIEKKQQEMLEGEDAPASSEINGVGDAVLEKLEVFTYGCTDMSFDTGKGETMTITCEKTSMLRTMTGLMAFLFTVLSISNIAFSSAPK